MPSCAALLMSAWASPPVGSEIAVAGDLAPLVEALRAVCPDLAQVEDFVPLDPRWRVRFRAVSDSASWDFRVHPGGLESPLLALQAAVDYAEALDPVLVPRFGYGIADMLQMAGQMLDAELEVMAPAWGDAEVSLASPPVVSEAEVAAARGYLESWQPDGILPSGLAALDDDRGGPLSLAAEGLTIDYQQLSYDAGPNRVHVGPALLVRGTMGVLPVPAALVIESLTSAVTVALGFMARHAEAPDEAPSGGVVRGESEAGVPRVSAAEAAETARRWRDRADSDLEWACRGLPATILFGYLGDGDHELLLVGPGHRHVVAVDLVTGLSPKEVADGIRAAWERLAGFGPGSLFRVSPPRGREEGPHREAAGTAPPPGTTGAGLAWLAGTADAIPFTESLLSGDTAAVATGTVVTRLVVVDGPWQHGPLWSPEIPVCTLDEFRSLLAAQDWQSTDREELWSFLDELASLGADDDGGGYAELFCWSILDAWEAWQEHGALCPAWVGPGTLARIPERDLDAAWGLDALLDGVDSVLTAAGMSRARKWSQLIPAPAPPVPAPERGALAIVATLTLYAPRRIWWVAADMGLVVCADLEFRDGLVFSRATLGMFADAIQDTLREVARQDPHAWLLWRAAHGDHPVVIQVTPAPLRDDMPPVRFAAMTEISDVLLADPLRLAALPGSEVHAAAGEALTFAMMARLQGANRSRETETVTDEGERAPLDGPDDAPRIGRVIEFTPSDEDIARAEAFRSVWLSLQPRLALRAIRAPFRPYELTPAQTLTENGRNRARRTVARRLRLRLAPGTHSLQAVLTELCPGALDAVRDAASGYSALAVLAAACGEIERALSDRYTSRATLEVSVGGPWAEEALADLDISLPSEEARRSRASELLVEALLSQPPEGTLVPDRRDVHQLLDLASAALEASLEAQYAYAAIRPAELNVSEHGDIEIVATGPARADIGTWQQAQLEDQARAGSSIVTGPAVPPASPAGADSADHDEQEAGRRRTLRSILEEDAGSSSGFQALNAGGLLRVDDQLIEYSGFGLDSVLAVLGTVTSWDVPAEPHPPIAQVTRAALVDDVTAWSGLPRQQVDAAVRACTLTAQQVRDEGLRYWQLRERGARLALRPLIEPPQPSEAGDLWLLPRCAHRTQHLLAAYLNDQQLPWPEAGLPGPVRSAVKAWRKLAEDQLEAELGTAAAEAGLIFQANLKENKARREGLDLYGEIDLIAADPARRRIWIIEAKHLRQVFSPPEIAFRIADFHGPDALAIGPGTSEFRQFRSRTFKPYVQKVLANTDAVLQNKQAAIRLIGITSSAPGIPAHAGDDWEVIPLVVTTYIDIAAFVANPQVPFVRIDHLRELLTASQPPSPGLWSPWTG